MEFSSFVLAAATSDLGVEAVAREHADALEFRMDRADDALSGLHGYDGELPVIATNRVDGEGGSAPAGAARLDDLEAATRLDCVGAVDVELAAVRDGNAGRVVDAARDHDAAVVVSVHDFDGTPAPGNLRELLDAATDRGDVGKLAVTAEDAGDVLDLLRVTHEFASAGRQVATTAMGETGRHSRAVAPLYGSRIGYAPVDSADATAPGQYDLATLSHLIDELE